MKYAYLIFTVVFLHIPLLTFAAEPLPYKALVTIPGLNGATDFSSFINSLYALSISLAALLAVIKIIIAGMKYMLSDVVTNKSEAKADIQSALLGLIIVISAVLIITIINPTIISTTP